MLTIIYKKESLLLIILKLNPSFINLKTQIAVGFVSLKSYRVGLSKRLGYLIISNLYFTAIPNYNEFGLQINMKLNLSNKSNVNVK